MISHLFSMMTLWSGVADIDAEQRHCGDEHRRWCDGERRWSDNVDESTTRLASGLRTQSQEDVHVDAMTRGRVHNVNEVGMTQRRRRRHDAMSEDVTWRRRQSHQLEANWDQTSWPTQLRYLLRYDLRVIL